MALSIFLTASAVVAAAETCRDDRWVSQAWRADTGTRDTF